MLAVNSVIFTCLHAAFLESTFRCRMDINRFVLIFQSVLYHHEQFAFQFLPFFLMGNLTIQEAKDAADLALARLQHGEKHLAIHPGCGTNLAVTGFCTAVGAMITLSGANSRKERWNRFSSLVSMSSLMVMISRPLGINAQKYITTDAEVSGLRIMGISASELFGKPCFFVETSLTFQEFN